LNHSAAWMSPPDNTFRNGCRIMVSKATTTRLSTCQPPRMPQRTDRTAVLVACATSQSSQTSATCQQLCWQTTAQFGPVIECRCFGCPFHGCRAALAQWPLTTIRARLVSDHCRCTIACRMLHATVNSTARWDCLDAYNTHCASFVRCRGRLKRFQIYANALHMGCKQV
jgi:hypothetical protein